MAPPGEGPKPELTAADAAKDVAALKRTQELKDATKEMEATRPVDALHTELDAKIDKDHLGDREKTSLAAADVSTAHDAAVKNVEDAYTAAIKKVGLDKAGADPKEKKSFDDWKKSRLDMIEKDKTYYTNKFKEIEEARKQVEIASAKETLKKAQDALQVAQTDAAKALKLAKEKAAEPESNTGNALVDGWNELSKKNALANASSATETLEKQERTTAEAKENLEKIDGTKEKAEAAAKAAKEAAEKAATEKLAAIGRTVTDFITDKVDALQQQLEKNQYNANAAKEIVGKAIVEVDKGMSREDVKNFIRAYNINIPFKLIYPGIPSTDTERVEEIRNIAQNSPELMARIKLHEDAKNAFHDKHVGKDGKVDFKGDKAAEQNTTLADLFPYANAITINGTLAFALRKEFYFASGERARVKNGDVVKPWTDSNSPEYWKGYFALRNTPYKSKEEALRDRSVIQRSDEIYAAPGLVWCPGNPRNHTNYATVPKDKYPPNKSRDEALADGSVVHGLDGECHTRLGLHFVDVLDASKNYATFKNKIDVAALEKELLPKLTALSHGFTEAKFSPADSDDLSKATNKRSDLMRDFYQIERKFEALGGENKGSPVERNIFGNVKSIYEKTLPLLDAKIATLEKAKTEPKATPDQIMKKAAEIKTLEEVSRKATEAYDKGLTPDLLKKASEAYAQLLQARSDLAKMKPGGTEGTAVAEKGADGKAADGKPATGAEKSNVAKAKKKIEKKEEKEEEVDKTELAKEATAKIEKLLGSLKQSMDSTRTGGEPTLEMIRAYGKLRGLGLQVKNVFTKYTLQTGARELVLASGKSLSSTTASDIPSVFGMISDFDKGRFSDLETNVTAGIKQFIADNKDTPFQRVYATSDIQESRFFADAYLHSGIATDLQKNDLRKIVDNTNLALAARSNSPE